MKPIYTLTRLPDGTEVYAITVGNQYVSTEFAILPNGEVICLEKGEK